MDAMMNFIAITLFYSGSFHEMRKFELYQHHLATYKGETGCNISAVTVLEQMRKTGEIYFYDRIMEDGSIIPMVALN